MKVKVVLEDMGEKENGAKAQVDFEYYPTRPETRLTSCRRVG
jgi:hypothetical protein